MPRTGNSFCERAVRSNPDRVVGAINGAPGIVMKKVDDGVVPTVG
jgi:hypothetical protein